MKAAAREEDSDTGPQGHHNTDTPIHLFSFTAPMAPVYSFDQPRLLSALLIHTS